MAFTQTTILRKKFTTSFTYDYNYMIIEGVEKNITWLKEKIKSCDLQYFFKFEGDYIKCQNPQVLKLIKK